MKKMGLVIFGLLITSGVVAMGGNNNKTTNIDKNTRIVKQGNKITMTTETEINIEVLNLELKQVQARIKSFKKEQLRILDELNRFLVYLSGIEMINAQE